MYIGVYIWWEYIRHLLFTYIKDMVDGKRMRTTCMCVVDEKSLQCMFGYKGKSLQCICVIRACSVCVCEGVCVYVREHYMVWPQTKKNCIRYNTVWILMKSVSMATRPNNHLWLASLDSLEWRALYQYNSMYAMSYVYGWLWSRRVVVSSLPSASTPPSSPQFWLFDFVAAACTVRDAASPSPEGWPFYYYIMLRFSMVGRAYCKWIGHEKTLKDFNSWTQMKRNEHGRKPIYFGS